MKPKKGEIQTVRKSKQKKLNNSLSLASSIKQSLSLAYLFAHSLSIYDNTEENIARAPCKVQKGSKAKPI